MAFDEEALCLKRRPLTELEKMPGKAKHLPRKPENSFGEHIREGKHGARSAKQAIDNGLSKARRAGVKLPPPKEGKTSERTRKQVGRQLCSKGKRRPGPEGISDEIASN